MIQRASLQRSTKPIRRKRTKPRRGPLRDRAYMNWLKERDCCVCAKSAPWVKGHRQMGVQIDPAHTENNGMRSKGPDSSCAPLCRFPHHREYDAGRKAFEMKYGVDMKNEAAAHWAAWQLVKEAA